MPILQMNRPPCGGLIHADPYGSSTCELSHCSDDTADCPAVKPRVGGTPDLSRPHAITRYRKRRGHDGGPGVTASSFRRSRRGGDRSQTGHADLCSGGELRQTGIARAPEPVRLSQNPRIPHMCRISRISRFWRRLTGVYGRHCPGDHLPPSAVPSPLTPRPSALPLPVVRTQSLITLLPSKPPTTQQPCSAAPQAWGCEQRHPLRTALRPPRG